MIDQRTAPYAAHMLRLASGVLFLTNGSLKVFVSTIPGTVGIFQSIGFPGFLAYLTTAAEIAGGLALIAGVGTRYVELALVPVLLGATHAHMGNGWLFTNEGDGWEFPAFWSVVLLAGALLGNGAFAVKLPTPRRATATA